MPWAACWVIAVVASWSDQRFFMLLTYSSGWMPASFAIFIQVAISCT